MSSHFERSEQLRDPTKFRSLQEILYSPEAVDRTMGMLPIGGGATVARFGSGLLKSSGGYLGSKAARAVGWELDKLRKAGSWVVDKARGYRGIPTELSNLGGKIKAGLPKVADKVTLREAKARVARENLAKVAKAQDDALARGDFFNETGLELTEAGRGVADALADAQKLASKTAVPPRPGFNPKPVPGRPAPTPPGPADKYLDAAGAERFGNSVPFSALVREWVKNFPKNHAALAGWGSAGVLASEALLLAKGAGALHYRVSGEKARKDKEQADKDKHVKQVSDAVANTWYDATNKVSSLSDASMVRDVIRKSMGAIQTEIEKTSGGIPENKEAIYSRGTNNIVRIIDSMSRSPAYAAALKEAEDNRDAWIDAKTEEGFAVDSTPGETYESYRKRKAAEFDSMKPINKILTVE